MADSTTTAKNPSTPATATATPSGGGNRGGGGGAGGGRSSANPNGPGQRRNSSRSGSRPSTRPSEPSAGSTPTSSPAPTAATLGSQRRGPAGGRTPGAGGSGPTDKAGSNVATPTSSGANAQRRTSRSGAGTSGPASGRRGSEVASPAATFGSPSSGEDRLRQMIGELKAIPASSSASSGLSSLANTSVGGGGNESTTSSASGVDSPGGRNSPSAPTKAKVGGNPARKNQKEGPPTTMKSTLNPNAGGFQPGALSSIVSLARPRLRASAC